jgi:hypothetical protein
MFAGWTTFSPERAGEATIIWHNAVLRSTLQTPAAPVTALRRRSRPAG